MTKKRKGESAYLNSDGSFKGGFDGAVKYFMSEGYDKEAATKIAGKIAASKGKTKKSMSKSMGNMSYNDLRAELQSKVQQKYGKKSKDGSYWTDYPWIVDVYEGEFVVEKDGKYYMADYTVDKDNNVSIDEFYPARKIYRKEGKTPVRNMGKGAANELADARG